LWRRRDFRTSAHPTGSKPRAHSSPNQDMMRCRSIRRR
jgi:hypothetical protein